jgi:hypothetical protein
VKQPLPIFLENGEWLFHSTPTPLTLRLACAVPQGLRMQGEIKAIKKKATGGIGNCLTTALPASFPCFNKFNSKHVVFKKS